MDQHELGVLLVEDDEIDAMNIGRAFRDGASDSVLVVVRSGAEALAVLRNQRSSPLPPRRRMILLDLKPPQMRELAFLRDLRRDPTLASVPVVILITSEQEREQIHEQIQASHLGAAGFLMKPVTRQAFDDLVAMLPRYWETNEVPDVSFADLWLSAAWEQA